MLVARSYPTLCDPTDCSPPGFSVRGILQARILEWVAIPSPGDLPDPGIEPGLLHCRQILQYQVLNSVCCLLITAQQTVTFTTTPTPVTLVIVYAPSQSSGTHLNVPLLQLILGNFLLWEPQIGDGSRKNHLVLTLNKIHCRVTLIHS